jgi:hypothetical protein
MRNITKSKQNSIKLEKSKLWLLVNRRSRGGAGTKKDRVSKKQAKEKDKAPSYLAKSTDCKLKQIPEDQNKIASFTAALIRLYASKLENNTVYGELSEHQPFLHSDPPLTDINEILSFIKKNKKNMSFIVKITTDCPINKGFYPAHWYFSSPSSPNDISRDIADAAVYNNDQNKNGALTPAQIKNAIKDMLTPRCLNNSYALGWQATATNQFCMMYALYGVHFYSEQNYLSSITMNKVPAVTPKEIYLASKNDLLFNDPVQNRNTKLLLTWFRKFMSEKFNRAELSSIVHSGNTYFGDRYGLREVIKCVDNGIKNPELFLPSWA